MELRCTLRNRNRTCFLTMVGDIDLDASDELLRVRDALGTRPGPLRVDLTGVTFMDLTGVHFLTDLRERGRADGTSLVLVGVPSGPARLLRLLGLTDFHVERPPAGVVNG